MNDFISNFDLNDYLYDNVYLNLNSETLLFTFILFVLHFTVKSKNKYFLIHFIFNVYVTINTIKDTLYILSNPYDVQRVSNKISFYVVIFHMYHMLFYANIQIDEIIHHIWIVFIIIPMTWIYYNNLANASLFFMTGSAGGTTYFLLYLRDKEVISKITEKYISKHLNMWIRIPGSIIVGYIIFLNSLH